ncbi:START domain-containing protein [Thiomicrorhabdus sp.]|uniref:START domain-containing protein n=1 Tax=Thiomicrorhabdus sp. TaxID=2039724 RepID=UPI002AA85A0D|nr:START domain-containing protein [Thiomicrorhabdus sp.]
MKFATLFTALFVTSLSYSNQVYAWDLEPTDEASPVKVWTQSVEGSSFKEFKGQVNINAPVNKILNVIRDTDNLPKWYYNTKQAKQLKKLSDSQALSYTVTKTPWPVTDRDSVTLSTQSSLDNGGYLIDLQAQPNAYPKQPDKIRVPKMQGFWKLEPVAKNKTSVTLQIAAEPGGEIPSWLANSMVIDMPFYTLTNLKQRIEQNPK